jgi:hypothetical protein
MTNDRQGVSRNVRWVPALVAISLAGIAAASPGQATETTIEQMPAKLETQFALSAVPPGLRDRATVHLLDPKKGYHPSRQGTSGVTCIVQRTSSLLYPFIDKQGNAEQSYVIQLIGEAERATILADEKALLAELCAYRDILCLADKKH